MPDPEVIGSARMAGHTLLAIPQAIYTSPESRRT